MTNKSNKLSQLLSTADTKTLVWVSLLPADMSLNQYNALYDIVERQNFQELTDVFGYGIYSGGSQNTVNLLKSIGSADEIYNFITDSFMTRNINLMDILGRAHKDYVAQLLGMMDTDKQRLDLLLNSYHDNPLFKILCDQEKIKCLDILDEESKIKLLNTRVYINSKEGAVQQKIFLSLDNAILATAIGQLEYKNRLRLLALDDIESYPQEDDKTTYGLADLIRKRQIDVLASNKIYVAEKIISNGNQIDAFAKVLTSDDYINLITTRDDKGFAILREAGKSALSALLVLNQQQLQNVLSSKNGDGTTLFDLLDADTQKQILNRPGVTIRNGHYNLHEHSISDIFAFMKFVDTNERAGALQCKDEKGLTVIEHINSIVWEHKSVYLEYIYPDDNPVHPKNPDFKAARAYLPRYKSVAENALAILALVPSKHQGRFKKYKEEWTVRWTDEKILIRKLDYERVLSKIYGEESNRPSIKKPKKPIEKAPEVVPDILATLLKSRSK